MAVEWKEERPLEGAGGAFAGTVTVRVEGWVLTAAEFGSGTRLVFLQPKPRGADQPQTEA